MLKEYIRKPWLNVYLFLFSHKMVSVQQKLNVKSLSEKYQALKDFESDLTKKLLKNTQMLIFWKKIKINEVLIFFSFIAFKLLTPLFPVH